MLTTIERRQKIVLMTEENGKVNVKDLAKTFDISEVAFAMILTSSVSVA